jgi:hypothetical protein
MHQARNALRLLQTTPASCFTLRPPLEMVMEDPKLQAESMEREFSDWWDERKIS